MIATVKIIAGRSKSKKGSSRPQYLPATPEEKEVYNETFKALHCGPQATNYTGRHEGIPIPIGNNPRRTENAPLEIVRPPSEQELLMGLAQERPPEDAATLQENIKAAQRECFRFRTQEAKQPYAPAETLELIKERQEARDRTNLETEWKLNRAVRNDIRRDKRKYWGEQLSKGGWQEVKATKKGFMPKFTKLRDDEGVVVPMFNRPDILADYFENKQWGGKLTPNEKEELAKVKEYRNNKLYEEIANTKVGNYI